MERRYFVSVGKEEETGEVVVVVDCIRHIEPGIADILVGVAVAAYGKDLFRIGVKKRDAVIPEIPEQEKLVVMVSGKQGKSPFGPLRVMMGIANYHDFHYTGIIRSERTKRNMEIEEEEERVAVYSKDRKVLAECDYIVSEGTLTILHTGVDKSLQGQGVGKKLVEKVEEIALREGLFLASQCSFASKLLGEGK